MSMYARELEVARTELRPLVETIAPVAAKSDEAFYNALDGPAKKLVDEAAATPRGELAKRVLSAEIPDPAAAEGETKEGQTLDETLLGRLKDRYNLRYYRFARDVTQITDQLSANSESLISGALSVTTTIGHVLAGVVITVFCLIFFLKDGPLIWTWLVRLVPVPGRVRVHEAGRRGLITLGAFTRTQILVALIDAVGIGLGALLLGLPLVVPLSVLVFLASFVPFVGAIATGSIAVLVALVDQGPTTALIMLIVVLGVQQL